MGSDDELVSHGASQPLVAPRATIKKVPSINLSPSKDGQEWQMVWGDLVTRQSWNPLTKKPYVWLTNLTKVLVYMWGSPQGVNSVMEMVEAVFSDLGTLILNATSSVNSSGSSVYTLERQCKRILSLSRAHVLQAADLLCEYKNMADDFARLEKQTGDPSTDLGKIWAKRFADSKLELIPQARSNVIMYEALKSMHMGHLTTVERESEMASPAKCESNTPKISK